MKKAVCLMLFIITLVTGFSSVYAEGVSISSETGDKISLFENIKIDNPVSGNVITLLGNTEVNSNVNGQVITVFGDATVNSRVSGQVITVFGNTTLTKKADIKGNLVTLGSSQKESGAAVSGQEVRILGEYMNIDIAALLYLRLALLILYALAVLVIGLLMIAVKKKQYEALTSRIEEDIGKKLLLGILAYIGISILLILLIITLVAPILYLVVIIVAAIPASIFFGRLILKAFNPKNGIISEFITGFITITLIKLLLLYLLPQGSLLVSLALVAVFDFFINSLGLGILMDAKYVKKTETV
jgi:hypothetical protein